MAVRPIYTDGALILRKKAHPVKHISDEIIQLILDMFETMRKANGIGLAANQVGILQRVIVIDISEMEGMEQYKPLTLINPEITEKKGECEMEEGCLSIPEIRDKVIRPETITLQYRDSNFHNVELKAEGLLARVIQHEIDHLNGVLFIDHLSSEQQKVHTDALKKIRQGELEVDYPIIAAVNVPG